MEGWITEAVMWLANTNPTISFVFMALGGIFVLAEIAVKITPSKEDDKWWARMMDGYAGKLIRVVKSFFLNRIGK